jgi:hypothetical protein
VPVCSPRVLTAVMMIRVALCSFRHFRYTFRVISREGYDSQWHPGLVLQTAHTPLRRYEMALRGGLACVSSVAVQEVGGGETLWVLALSSKLDPTIASTMASTITNPSANPSANANTRSRRKRARGTAGEENPSAIKRPKRETKLDKQKAQLKEAVGLLKNKLMKLEEYFLDAKIAKENAKESAKMMYTTLLVQCDNILEDNEPNEVALALFKEPFVDNFQPEEVLQRRLSPGMLPSRRARLR